MDVDEENLNSIMRLNVFGVLVGTQQAARQMMAQESGGKIINTASIAGRQGYAEFAPYCSSRSAAISLTQAGARIREAQDDRQRLCAARRRDAPVGRTRAGHDR
jgi:meso-butanediol dehydrogenase/(S,S)-butanediol dehydrogenase/diacetyl reductase